jgi:hypothetical protein
MQKRTLLAVTAFAACVCTSAMAQLVDTAPLLQAMSDRNEYGAALRTLKQVGYLSARPQIRSNYDDYYRPLRAFNVLGNRVVVVQENYLVRDVGCCADPGIGLYFESNSSTSLSSVRDFALANKCIYYQGPALLAAELPRSFLRFRANKFYALMRCSDGDEARMSR